MLALKLADLGIAMGSGAPATRAVAELVLLNGSFGALPGVVAEGRRVTANILDLMSRITGSQLRDRWADWDRADQEHQ